MFSDDNNDDSVTIRANHSSILAWRIPRTAESGGLQSAGAQEPDTTEGLNVCK